MYSIACLTIGPRLEETQRLLLAVRVLLWSATLAVPTAVAQEEELRAVDSFNEPPPSFSIEQAQVWMSDVIPHVEKVTGRRFGKRPILKVVTRSELRDAIISDAELIAGDEFFQDVSNLDRTIELVFASKEVSAVMLGKYSLSEEEILLPAGNAAHLFKAAGIDIVSIDDVMRVVIAHELAHALQDQEINLARCLSETKDVPRLRAFSAAMEGFALVVQDMVADRMKMTDAAERLERLLPGGHIRGKPNSMPKGYLGDVARVMTGSYEHGRTVMELAFEAKGKQGLWEALRSPPEALRVVNSRAGVAQSRSRPKYVQVFAGLDSMLQRAWTEIKNAGAPPSEGLQFFKMLDERSRAEVESMLEYVHSFACLSRFPGKNPEFFVVVTYVLPTPQHEPKFNGFVRKAAAANRQIMSMGGLVDVRIEQDSLSGVSGSTPISRRVWSLWQGGTLIGKQTLLWAGKDKHVIQLYTNAEIDENTIMKSFKEAVVRVGRLAS